jgi:two-component sensor histidine kinase
MTGLGQGKRGTHREVEDQMSRSQEVASVAGRRLRIDPLRLYTTSLSVLAVGLLAWSLVDLPRHLPEPVLLFIMLVVVAELATSGALVPQIAFSMSAAVTFAMLLLFGSLTAILGAVAGGMMATVMTEIADRRCHRSRAPLLQRAPFNIAAFALPVAAAGALYRLLGGQIGEVGLPSNLLPMALAAISIEFTNASLVVGAVSLQTGKPAFHIWKQNVSWAVPMSIVGMLVGGGGLALGYQIAGILGIGVFFLPLVLMIYGFQLYVSRTKSQMDELQQNIAERQRAEEQLRTSLRDKEVLLQEIHHRVKNNLQIMSSLLHLQSRHVTDQETLAMFKESRNRIRSMALVHEKLYQSSDLSQINFAQYVRSLGSYLLRSYGVDPGLVRLQIDAQDAHLSIDTAVPCGLVINELISNALKHAFPDGRDGEIRLEFHQVETGRFVLTVHDDGVGFAPDPVLTKPSTLGLQLVNTLVDQLEGTIAYDHSDGTTIRVVFADLTYHQKVQS